MVAGRAKGRDRATTNFLATLIAAQGYVRWPFVVDERRRRRFLSRLHLNSLPYLRVGDKWFLLLAPVFRAALAATWDRDAAERLPSDSPGCPRVIAASRIAALP